MSVCCVYSFSNEQSYVVRMFEPLGLFSPNSQKCQLSMCWYELNSLIKMFVFQPLTATSGPSKALISAVISLI